MKQCTHPVQRRLDGLDLVAVSVCIDGIRGELREHFVTELVNGETGCGNVGRGCGGRLQQWVQV